MLQAQDFFPDRQRPLIAIVKRIVDAGAQFRSLAEPWADTAQARAA